MPICSKCHLDKSITEFTSNKSRLSGFNPACKECDAPNVYKRQFAERGGPLTDDKRCNKCGVVQVYTAFRVMPRNKDGLDTCCGTCRSFADKIDYYRTSPRQHKDPVHMRFWRLVDTSGGPDACWSWEGQFDDGGYGLSKHTDKGKTKKAHRVAWELTYGDIPDGMSLLHRCNNRACVNVFGPQHLYLGTQKDNMVQAGLDGRMKGPSKMNNPPQQLAPRNRQHSWAKNQPWEDRFWVKVLLSEDPDACWLWTASLIDGYGQFRLDGKIQKAHIVSYRIAHGEFDPTFQVRHTCDQRACVNPSHLIAGPKIENMWDMIVKGRHHHVIPLDKIPYIRSQKGIQSSNALAKEFGVTRAAISAIWNKRTYPHLS